MRHVVVQSVLIFKIIYRKKVFLVLLILFFWNIGSVFSQSTDTIPQQIINPDEEEIISYCNDSVAVAPNITFQNIKFDDQSEGIKISIANYNRGEDLLVYNEFQKFEYKWVEYYGHLEIIGVGTEKEYEEAVANVFYRNISNFPTLGVRSFSISLLDADYLPETQHFYRYISSLDITWTEARDSASNMNYYGLKGYLATITSSVENDFIWTKIDGIGWIGASDEEVEGKWIWATGPEKGTHFWQGGTDGSRVNGEYSNWVPNHEPNNLNDEDYAHINQHPDRPQKSWNDLNNEGGGSGSQYYRAQGFIVEFGGTSNDPQVKLSASAQIQVSKIAFSEERDFTICQGESQELNLVADDSYNYTWLPDKNINSAFISNPVVNPGSTTTYTAIGKHDYCTDTADFLVNVNPVPVHDWEPEYTICEGDSITLVPGKFDSYLWRDSDTSKTITVKDEGWYWVTVTNEFDCSSIDSTEVKWSVSPELDYGELKTLVCGSKTQTLNLKFTSGSATTNLIALQPDKASVADPKTLTPTIIVNEFGVYQFKMEIKDEYSCNFSDTLEIEFHNQPEAKFLSDEEKCKGYSLDLKYEGTTVEDAIFSWYSNDTVYESGVDLKTITIPLGYGQKNRTVGLIVNEQGCIDSSFVPVSVTPVMNFWVEENASGCTPLQTTFRNENVEDIESYFWDFGDGNTDNIENPENTYINSGVSNMSFDVKLTVVSAEGCENTGVLKDTITVYPIPIIDLSFDEDDCNPESMEIWYKGSGSENDTYLWDLADFQPGEILVDPGTTAGPLKIERSSEPTVDIGLHVISEFGCNTDSIIKTWKRKPVFEITVDNTEGCPPLETAVKATLFDEVDKVSFNYNLGDGTIGAGDSVVHTYTVPDTKNEVQFTANSSVTGCSETLTFSKEIYTYPVPKANFVPDPVAVIISDPIIVFENKSTEATYYEWDFDDNSAISIEVNPQHGYTSMGFFEVLLWAFNDLGCLDSTTQRVAVAFDKIFPPNAFSPNAINQEDREFRIHSEGIASEGYQLLIFNRWGGVIFESESQENGWDGKMKNGNYAPSGVYTWVIQYNDFKGEKHKQQGAVTLII